MFCVLKASRLCLFQGIIFSPVQKMPRRRVGYTRNRAMLVVWARLFEDLEQSATTCLLYSRDNMWLLGRIYSSNRAIVVKIARAFRLLLLITPCLEDGSFGRVSYVLLLNTRVEIRPSRKKSPVQMLHFCSY